MQHTDQELAIEQLKMRISHLQDILDTMQHDSELKCSIELSYKSGAAYFIEQDIIPFNLAMEAKMLIAASIDHYQRVIQSLRG